MTAKLFYKLVLITLTSLVVYYILVAGYNLIFKLAVPNEPVCNPLFCKEIVRENANCLIKTPGFPECVDIEGYFYVLSAPWAYSLLALSLLSAFYFSKRFYLTRIFFVLLTIALILLIIRIILGTAALSLNGASVEFNKLGLNQPVFETIGQALFKMAYPKL